MAASALPSNAVASVPTPADAVLLTEHQKAAELQCSVSFLRKDRLNETPLVPYRKVGGMVRYFPTSTAKDEVA